MEHVPETLTVLPQDVWLPRAQAHRERAEHWTLPHLERRDRGEKHPVEDFLFDYYDLAPSKLARWHPGLDVVLEGPATAEYAALGAYVDLGDGRVTADPSRLAKRLRGLTWTRELLSRTSARPARFGCFGMHEWAMVYRTDSPRHPHPLRLGADGTADVVESHQLACTHTDAFRFFTSAATPRNPVQLTRENQLEHEQPGCLHANMDLYKVAHRLLPFVEATVVLDCFELAREIRTTDMEASPYDLTAFGYEPLPVETPEGKAEYVRRQRGFSERANVLRERLLADVDALLARNVA